MSLKNDLQIDEFALDDELKELPLLLEKYMQLYDQAEHEHKRAKMRLERAEAKLVLDIRKNPKSYDLDKISESSVLAAVKASSMYKKQMAECLLAEKDKKSYATAVRAIEAKKDALKGLISLHTTEYFLTPRNPSNHRRTYDDLDVEEEVNKQAAQRKRKRMRRRKPKEEQ